MDPTGHDARSSAALTLLNGNVPYDTSDVVPFEGPQPANPYDTAPYDPVPIQYGSVRSNSSNDYNGSLNPNANYASDESFGADVGITFEDATGRRSEKRHDTDKAVDSRTLGELLGLEDDPNYWAGRSIAQRDWDVNSVHEGMVDQAKELDRSPTSRNKMLRHYLRVNNRPWENTKNAVAAADQWRTENFIGEPDDYRMSVGYRDGWAIEGYKEDAVRVAEVGSMVIPVAREGMLAFRIAARQIMSAALRRVAARRAATEVVDLGMVSGIGIPIRFRVAVGPRMIPGIPGEVAGGSSTKLGRNLMAEMGLPRGTSWTGYQAQHIIPSEVRAHAVLKRIGMNLDDASNGQFLRTPDGMTSAMSRHRGYHSVYNEVVERALSRMDASAPIRQLEQQVYGLQQRLGTLQQAGMPLYPSHGATVELWERTLAEMAK